MRVSHPKRQGQFTFQYNDKNEILLRVVSPHNSVLDKP